MLGDMLAPCVPVCPSVFSPQTCPQVAVAFVPHWPGRVGLRGSRGPGSWDRGRDLACPGAHPANAEHGAL